MTVGHKKASLTLVDDCIDKFRQHEVERKRLRLPDGRRGSADSKAVEFFMGGEGAPLSSVVNVNTEESKVPAVDDTPVGGNN